VQKAYAVYPGTMLATGISEFLLLSSMKSYNYCITGRGQWSRCRRCGSAAAHLLGLRVWIPLRAWISICCVL